MQMEPLEQLIKKKKSNFGNEIGYLSNKAFCFICWAWWMVIAGELDK